MRKIKVVNYHAFTRTQYLRRRHDDDVVSTLLAMPELIGNIEKTSPSGSIVLLKCIEQHLYQINSSSLVLFDQQIETNSVRQLHLLGL